MDLVYIKELLIVLGLVFSSSNLFLGEETSDQTHEYEVEIGDNQEEEGLFKMEEHNYTYYTYKFNNKSLWIGDEDFGSPLNKILENSYLHGKPVRLQTDFIFYGHLITDILITSGGFIYMGEFLHRQLTYSQFIAPLMANFETLSVDNVSSSIKYYSNNTILIVWWNNMKLRHVHNGDRYTFQLVYYSKGTILFNYKKIPMASFLLVKDKRYHRVAVGLSDAYYLVDEYHQSIHLRALYEYHNLLIPVDEVLKFESVVIKPLPNCVEQKTCESCALAKISSKLDCRWCPSMEVCSDGFDRLRQKWFHHECPENNISSREECSLKTPLKKKIQKKLQKKVIVIQLTTESVVDLSQSILEEVKYAVILVCCLFFFFSFTWFMYALKYPNSPSGRWLIEHRCARLAERFRGMFSQRTSPVNEAYISFERNRDNVMFL